MDKTKSNPIVNFPNWKSFDMANQAFIDRNEYIGFSVKQRICNNMYFSIECRNDKAIWKDSDKTVNRIRVQIGTDTGFAIAFEEYEYCKDAYLTAIFKLTEWANEFSKAFNDFLKNSTIDD